MTFRDNLWQNNAECLNSGSDPFFPEAGDNSKTFIARNFCKDCRVINECLEYALWSGEKFGVWGGTTERERRQIRRERAKEGESTGGRDNYRSWDFFKPFASKH